MKLFRYFNQILPNYKKKLNKINKTVIFSYLNTPYWLKNCTKYMISHNNRSESVIIKDIFLEKEFNFISLRFDKKNMWQANKNPEIIFGIEPNFIALSELYPFATKIYYATGAYYEHQNRVIIERTDQLNIFRKSAIPYSRLVIENNAAETADYIFQIGSQATISTYPEHLRKKIFLIRPTTFDFLKLDIEKKMRQHSKFNFMWIGSNGSVLKGLDLLLLYFKNHLNLHLYVVGNIDIEFSEEFSEELYHSENIHYMGYHRMDDETLNSIASKCTFIIFPSASEGIPGSVINMMKLGLIPIVSRYAGFDGIDSIGFVVEDLSIKSVEKSINKAMLIQEESLMGRFLECSSFIESNFNIDVFKNDVQEALERVMKNENMCSSSKL